MPKRKGERNKHVDPLSSTKVNSFGHGTSIDGVAPLRVVLVAEPLHQCADLLMPVAPHSALPFALLPISNTPLIDYVLENLMDNGVDSIVVLLRENDEKVTEHLKNKTSVAVQSWIRQARLRMEPVLPVSDPITFSVVCDNIKLGNVLQSGFFLIVPINTLSSFTGLRMLFHKHLTRTKTIPQYVATVLCTSHSDTLKGVHYNVLEETCRKDELKPHRGSAHDEGVFLSETRMEYMGEGYREEEDDDDEDEDEEEEGGATAGSHSRHRSLGRGVLSEYRKRRMRVPCCPTDFHTMIVYDEDTAVIEFIGRCEARHRHSFLQDDDDGDSEEEDSDEEDDDDEDVHSPVWKTKVPLITFGSGTKCVRMDLFLTNFIFFSTESLSLVQAGEDDVHAFLNDLLANAEIQTNSFGFVEIPRSSGMLENITTMDSYIRANIDVCGRRFYPMTRESCFAENKLSYEVAPWSETVYLHTTSKAPPGAFHHRSIRFAAPSRLYGEHVQNDGRSGPHTNGDVRMEASSSMKLTERFIGPYVVLGPNVSIPASTLHCAGVACESNVMIGEDCSLVGCVIMAGARIGARCQLRYVIVGKEAVIENDITLVNCLVEHYAVVSRSNCDQRQLQAPKENLSKDVDKEDLRLCLENLVVVIPEGKGKEKRSTEHPKGIQFQPLPLNLVLPTETLFLDDPVAAAESDEDVEEKPGAAEKYFCAIIRRGVRAAYEQPLSIIARRVEFSTACVSYKYTYAELCRFVMQFLIQNLEKRTEDFTKEEILEEATKVFTLWIHEFYDFLFPGNSMDHQTMIFVLEGLCEAIRDENSHLFPLIDDLLDLLHARCIPSLYDSRGHCLVGSQALRDFSQRVRQYDTSSDDEDSDENEGVLELPASRACAEYVERKLIPRTQPQKTNFMAWLDDDTSSSSDRSPNSESNSSTLDTLSRSSSTESDDGD